MRNVDIINKIDKDFNISKLVRDGIISPKLLFYRDIYNEIDANKKMGIRMEEAVMNVCDKMRVERTTVYRAYKIMNNE